MMCLSFCLIVELWLFRQPSLHWRQLCPLHMMCWEFPCVNKGERHNCCLLICGQRTAVLAPLISSEEGGDMNVSAVWQLLSWFTTQRAACLCQAGENLPQEFKRLCVHAEKMTYCPVVLFTSEVSPGTARKAKGVVNRSWLGQIWDARGLFQFGKIKASAICCLITQATSVRLVVVLVLEEPYCEMFSFRQISQPPGPTSFSLPDDWDNRTSYLHSPFSTGRSCTPLHDLYWLSSSWSLLLFWGLE